jgi:hypothetical protein
MLLHEFHGAYALSRHGYSPASATIKSSSQDDRVGGRPRDRLDERPVAREDAGAEFYGVLRAEFPQ